MQVVVDLLVFIINKLDNILNKFVKKVTTLIVVRFEMMVHLLRFEKYGVNLKINQTILLSFNDAGGYEPLSPPPSSPPSPHIGSYRSLKTVILPNLKLFYFVACIL